MRKPPRKNAPDKPGRSNQQPCGCWITWRWKPGPRIRPSSHDDDASSNASWRDARTSWPEPRSPGLRQQPERRPGRSWPGWSGRQTPGSRTRPQRWRRGSAYALQWSPGIARATMARRCAYSARSANWPLNANEDFSTRHLAIQQGGRIDRRAPVRHPDRLCLSPCLESRYMAASTRYNAADIEVLSGLEPVRRRPGMYTDTTRPNHLVQEVVDNSVDEALAGHAKQIDVTVHKDGSVTVIDDGRGMPVDIHPEEGLPGVELILTRLHAGAKFSDRNYTFSG